MAEKSKESFPSVMEGPQPGKLKPSGRAPRGPTWTDEETRILLGHWHTLLVQRRVQNMPTNSDLYAVLAKKMAEEGFIRTRIQCNNRIRDLRKAYRKAKDAMGRAGTEPVRCRFFRELDEICGGEAESVPSSVSQAVRLQPSVAALQPAPSWKPVPEISWKVEEDSETEAALDGIGDAPLEPLKIKVESELEEAAAFQLPMQPLSSSSTSTMAVATTLEEDQLPTLQEPDILLPTRPTVQALKLLTPANHSGERLEVEVQDNTATGRSSWESKTLPRPPELAVDRVAQMRARRRGAREETVDRLLEEMRAGREALDTSFRLFLEQQRSFQNSLIREMRLARQEQHQAAEAELQARQEEWQQQKQQHVLDMNRSDMEMARLRQELSLLRHTFMDFFSASSSQQRTPSPIPSQKEGADSSQLHWEGGTPTASHIQAPLPDLKAFGMPSRGRRGRPRKNGSTMQRRDA